MVSVSKEAALIIKITVIKTCHSLVIQLLLWQWVFYKWPSFLQFSLLLLLIAGCLGILGWRQNVWMKNFVAEFTLILQTKYSIYFRLIYKQFTQISEQKYTKIKNLFFTGLHLKIIIET